MQTNRFVLIVVFLVISVASAAAGQHDHQPPALSAAQVAQCGQAQLVVAGLLEEALKRLEDARLTNSPTVMRDVADDVQSALNDVRSHLAPCGRMQAADERGATPKVDVTPPPAVPPATRPASPAPVPPPTAPHVH